MHSFWNNNVHNILYRYPYLFIIYRNFYLKCMRYWYKCMCMSCGAWMLPPSCIVHIVHLCARDPPTTNSNNNTAMRTITLLHAYTIYTSIHFHLWNACNPQGDCYNMKNNSTICFPHMWLWLCMSPPSTVLSRNPPHRHLPAVAARCMTFVVCVCIFFSLTHCANVWKLN